VSDVFISYARSTAREARVIAEGLRGRGYSVWWDEDLPSHRAYSDVIEEQLQGAKAVLVIWSAEAVKSEWVRSEANRAREERKLSQVSVDASRLPMPFDQVQCADLTGWTGDLSAAGWRKVVASVGDLVGGERFASAPAPAAAPRRLSVCVLPFANMSGDPEQEYFSDGISEDIITDLSKVSALGVIARNTAFGFKGKSPNIKDVARELDVSHVLEGSVRKAGERVRITAQLIDGSTGEHAWAERYDRNLDDIFALQDEISEAIVTALKLKLLPEEKKAIERRGTGSAEAYDLVLLSRSYGRTGNDGDPRMYEAMERLCRQAVEIDPGYPQAWRDLAMSQYMLHRLFARANDRGAAALDRALALDPELGEAHSLKSSMLSDAGRYEEAAAEIAVALRLDPESFTVNNSAATNSYLRGQLADAVRYFEKAMLLDDTALNPPLMLVSCYTALGEGEHVRRTARIALERAERAIAQDRSNGRAMQVAVAALAGLDKRDRAKDWMRRALVIDADNLLMRYNFACSLATSLGDPEAALDMLGPVLTRGTVEHLTSAKADPDFTSLRGDPRFQAMIAAAEARLAAVDGEPPSEASVSGSPRAPDAAADPAPERTPPALT
jgi:adenylate cyclase